MKVRDLQPRMPVTVTKGETLGTAAKRLAEEEIGALVVFEPGGLVGVLSERDLVRAIADASDLEEIRVCEYMTDAPILIDQEAPVEEAATKMNEAAVRHLVVTENSDVCGVVSIRDVLVSLGGEVAGR